MGISVWSSDVCSSDLLFLGILPSTGQSATAASSLAGGNVAASVVAAALLNLSGVALSPLLFALLAGNAGDIHGEAVLRIVSILLLPFVAGQLVQRWLRPWVLAHRGLAPFLDRSAIAIAVYVAFSAAVVAGSWGLLAPPQIVLGLPAVGVLLAPS